MTDVGIAGFLVLGELYRRRCAQPAVGCGLLSAYNGLPGTAAEVNYYFVSIRMVFLLDYFLSAGYQDLEVNQFDISDVEVAGVDSG